jgi:mRNA-degrading endonuclease YafQ of YafQ-DinJ toxin-antitoxin module
MNRRLVRTPAFIRAAKRFLKRHPEAVDSLAITLAMMEDDVFHRRLRTHKLQGDLDGCWACSGGYDVRIVFRIISSSSNETIALLAVGTHDEVY